MTGLLTLAYYFDPGGAVGALRLWRFHRYLKQLGFSNKIVAAFAKPGQDPDVSIVPDTATEYWDRRGAALAAGNTVESIPFDAHVERLLRKTVCAGQFGIGWSRPAAARSAVIIRNDASITHIISTYPPLGGHVAAMHVARKFGLKWIADFRDPIRYGPNTLSRTCLPWIEKRVFTQADAIVANTEFSAAVWRRNFPWAADKIHVIWNGFDPENELPALPVPEGHEDWIVHAGTLYSGRNANVVVAGFARLRAAGVPRARNIRVVLAGPVDQTSGVDEGLYATATESGWLDMPRRSIPREDAQRLTQEAGGLLLLQPQSNEQVPAKLFEYLSIGRPILALVPRQSAIEWILQRAGVPFTAVYSDEDADSVDAKLKAYLALPRTATVASEWFRTNFDSRRQTGQLAAIIAATGAHR